MKLFLFSHPIKESGLRIICMWGMMMGAFIHTNVDAQVKSQISTFLQSIPAQIDIGISESKGSAQISWFGFTGKRYIIQHTESLELNEWRNFGEESYEGKNDSLSAEINTTHDTQGFFRILKLDTEGPRIAKSFPSQNGIAIQSNSSIILTFVDQTGVDPESIQFVYEEEIYSVSHSQLSFDEDKLTFNLLPGKTWGEPGSEVNIQISANDLLGNSMIEDYHLSFQLELETIPSGELIFVGPKIPNDSTPISTEQDLELVSKTASELTYHYEGDTHGFSVGQILISRDPNDIFYRRVLHIEAFPQSNKVVLETEQLSFPECYEQTSFSNRDWIPVSANTQFAPQGYNPLFEGEKQVSLGGDLSGLELISGDGYKLTIEEGNWNFPLNLEISGNQRRGQRREVSLIGSGHFASSLTIRGEMDTDISTVQETPLISPTRKFYFIPRQGWWAIITLEVEASIKCVSNVRGEFSVGFDDMEVDVEFGVRHQGDQSRHISNSSRQYITPGAAFDYDLEGEIWLLCHLTPKISIRTVGMADAWISMQSQLELTAEKEPPNDLTGARGFWNYRLDAWLSGRYGADETSGWPAGSGWNLLRNGDNIFKESGSIEPINYEAPVILTHPGSQSIDRGDSADLFVQASGIPDPTFEWYKDGILLVGTNSDHYHIPVVDASSIGDYTAKATNSAGSAMSNPATISITDEEDAGSGLPGPPVAITELDMTLMPIPAGTFTMGSLTSEKDSSPQERPRMNVTLSDSFWIGRTEVTQAQWQSIMGNNPSRFQGNDHHPVESITWQSAMNFCNQLNTLYSINLPSGYQYTLPTEAQWEYACRAGSTTRFYYGDDLNYQSLKDYAWYRTNSSNQTNPVGLKIPNDWNLFDMSGNVREWCLDWYVDSYPGGSVFDPTGPMTGTRQVYRGGSFAHVGKQCRSARRDGLLGSEQSDTIGFRVAISRIP